MKLRYAIFGSHRAPRLGMGLIGVAVGLSSLTALGADPVPEGVVTDIPAVTPGSAEALPVPAAPAPTPTPAVPDPTLAVPPPAPKNPGLEVIPAVIPFAGAPAVAPDPNAVPADGQPAPMEVPTTVDPEATGAVDPIGELPEVAQGFGDRPTGFSNGVGDFSLASRLGESPFRGFNFGLNLTGTYDSNPTQGYGGPNQTSDGDFFATLGGSIGYRTTASTLTFGANYSGSYNEYFSQSELSGFNHSGGLSANYDGGAFTAALNIGLGYNDGANRYYEAMVTQFSVNYAVSGSYRMSAKTSLTANFGQTLTDPNGGYSTTGDFNAGASAMWHYSDRTQFGPGIRYTSDSAESDNFRTTIGPTVTVNYRVTGKISLNAMTGVDFVQYDQGDGDDTSIPISLSLNYQASPLWGMYFSIYRDVQASPTLYNGSQEITNFSLGYHRKIRRASWTVGVSYEMGAAGTYSDPNGTSADSDYFSFNTGLSMPVFADNCSARVFMNWTGQNGSTTDSDGSFQAGVGLNWSF
jgi:hypothetical protein